MNEILRAGDRFRSEQDGITSRHCFSTGAHYDPDNVSFGPIVGVDEHLLAPGAGFDWHAHRGVDIVSWVLSGALRHEDDSGHVLLVGPGQALLQSTGTGIRHTESNPSRAEPLRFVQTTLLGESGPDVRVERPPATVGAARFSVWHADASGHEARWLALATTGAWRLADAVLEPGDSARGSQGLNASGTGELLVWSL